MNPPVVFQAQDALHPQKDIASFLEETSSDIREAAHHSIGEALPAAAH
jgi:hypothetical protein